MSFLENPFADDEEAAEEPIVSGSPFGDYEATQKENEYNAYFVQSTTLEERLPKQREQSALAVSEQVRRARELREELTSLSAASLAAHAAERAPTSQGASSSDADAAAQAQQLHDASLAVVAELEKQFAESRAKGAALSHAVRVFRGRIAAQADTAAAERSDRWSDSGGAVSPRSEAGWEEGALTAEASGPSAGGEDGGSPESVLRFDTTDLEKCVGQLVELQGATLAEDDTDLVAAALTLAKDVLQQHERHVAHVARSYHEARRRHRSVEVMRAVADSLDALVADSPGRRRRRVVDEVPLTSEEKEAEDANEDLTREIQRLESTLASALRDASSLSSVADHHAGAAALAHTLSRRDELAKETEAIGREVLFLRDVVLRPTSRTGASTVAALKPSSSARSAEALALLNGDGFDGGDGEGSVPVPTATDSLGQRLVARTAVVDEVLEGLCGGVSGEGQTITAAQTILETSLLKARIAFSESFLPLQGACVAALQSINEQLRKQAYGAALLTQLAVHDTGFNAAVISRLSEVPAPQLPPSSMDAEEGAPNLLTLRGVAEWYLTLGSSTPLSLPSLTSELSEKLSSSLTADGEAWRRRQAGWQRVNEGLTRMLSLSSDAAVVAPLVERRPEQRTLPSCPPFVLRGEVAAKSATDVELADASQAAERHLHSVTEALQQRRKELEKTLAWFNRQRHTAPLRALRAIEKESISLAAQLQNFRSVAEEAERSSHTSLPVLREKLAKAKGSVSALKAETVALETQLKHARNSISQLSV